MGGGEQAGGWAGGWAGGGWRAGGGWTDGADSDDLVGRARARRSVPAGDSERTGPEWAGWRTGRSGLDGLCEKYTLVGPLRAGQSMFRPTT